MKTCDRIKGLRVGKSITQKELGELVGASTVTVQCWERGSKNPSMDAIISLAQTFNVSTDYLLGVKTDLSMDRVLDLTKSERSLLSDYRSLDKHGRDIVNAVCRLEKQRVVSDKNIHSEQLRYIPKYLTPSAAGVSIPLEGEDFEMIAIDGSVPLSADYAVKIQGDSMLPYIHDGDTIFVHRTQNLKSGDIGIFCVDGAMYCKHFLRDGDGNVSLLSANPAFKDTNIYIRHDSGREFVVYGSVLLKQKPKLPDYIVAP